MSAAYIQHLVSRLDAEIESPFLVQIVAAGIFHGVIDFFRSDQKGKGLMRKTLDRFRNGVKKTQFFIVVKKNIDDASRFIGAFKSERLWSPRRKQSHYMLLEGFSHSRPSPSAAESAGGRGACGWPLPDREGMRKRISPALPSCQGRSLFWMTAQPGKLSWIIFMNRFTVSSMECSARHLRRPASATAEHSDSCAR